MRRQQSGDPLVGALTGMVVDMPAPANLSSWWNLGSLLGVCLSIQLATGVMLAVHFVGSVEGAFDSVIHICRDVGGGWLLRFGHANGASLFFVLLFLHVGRGLYYSSFRHVHTWLVGVTLLLAVMATAFLGYVLPWGQMSLWGATVITNLLTSIPVVGGELVMWLWGGYAVGGATLTRFYAFHFLLPFIISALVAVHIVYLHQSGSGNPLGPPSADLIPLHPYLTSADLVKAVLVVGALLNVALLAPYVLGDPENLSPANPLSTPPHIQPEWYYLFAYAILRSVPNKLGGVVALAVSVLVLYVSPLAAPSLGGAAFRPLGKAMFWSLVVALALLTWVGARPVEEPFVAVGQALAFWYFVAVGAVCVLP